MNQSKTAMQILIEKMKEELLHLNEKTSASVLLTATIRLATELLLDERIQIKRAFTDGEQNVWDRHKNENDFEFENASNYFNKTFNNESESIEEKIEI
jgi:hypothetical protein